MFDWRSTEETLFSLLHGDIEQFAPQHQAEEFYGFFLDYDPYYGTVYPSLNTLELLRQRAETYKYDVQSIGGPGTAPDLYADKTIGEIEERLRWSPADWGYLQINRRDLWRQHWAPIRKIIEDVRDEDDSFEEQFRVMACRLLIRIEDSGVLDLLRRTQDFGALCADSDETLDVARARLERIRQDVAGS
jgi:hypothetical protein